MSFLHFIYTIFPLINIFHYICFEEKITAIIPL